MTGDTADLPYGAAASAKCRAGAPPRAPTDPPNAAASRRPRQRPTQAGLRVASLPGRVLPGLVSAVRAWSAHPRAAFHGERNGGKTAHCENLSGRENVQQIDLRRVVCEEDRAKRRLGRTAAHGRNRISREVRGGQGAAPIFQRYSGGRMKPRDLATRSRELKDRRRLDLDGFLRKTFTLPA